MLPSVFLSHGSPMHALEPGAVGLVWAGLGRRFAGIRALLVASAHWETDVPTLTGGARPETIHDFTGFPEPLYRLRYPAPGAPEVAGRARRLLEEAGYGAALDAGRGLDHGAWSPLLYAYPQADIPVVQISVQTALGPRHHLGIGRALRPLAGEGILVVGSGHMTHNLRDRRRGAPPAAYAVEFRDWVGERIARNEFERLADYRSNAPHGARAHPSEEHFLPLFVALGAAAANARPERVFDAVEDGSLAMDAYVFNPA